MSSTDQSDATTTLARGFDLLSSGQLEAALSAFSTAERSGANADECSGGRWRAYMLLGEMESAWIETDAIRSRANPDPHRFWNGSALSGKRLIVRCLHGYGDTIQMIRFIPQLLSLAERVTLEVQPRLLPLLTSTPFLRLSRLEIITWGDHAPSVPPLWDIQMEIMEVPYVLRITSSNLPGHTCYLEPSPSDILKIRREIQGSSTPQVGLVWTAGEWNQDRAIPFQQIRTLLRAPVRFWSLVNRDDYQKAFDSQATSFVEDSGAFGAGIAMLTAVVSKLSLVVTADTLAAHLAGALGIPVWVLLPYAADWRWMQGERSPWYPSMRLFRQRTPGDWAEVMQRVGNALETSFLKESSDGKVLPLSAK